MKKMRNKSIISLKYDNLLGFVWFNLPKLFPTVSGQKTSNIDNTMGVFFCDSLDQESRREGWTDARSAVGFCLGSGLFGSYNSD